MDELRRQAQEHIRAAQQRQKHYADLKRSEVEYTKNDKVLLSTVNLKLTSTGARKIMPKYVGPFRILERIGKVAYRLELPEQMKCHPVFHVSLLAPWREGAPFKPPPWRLLAPDAAAEVERLLDHRTRAGSSVRDDLMQWAGAHADDATRIPESRVPPSLLSEYWHEKDPGTTPQGSGLEHPLSTALRRSSRHLGLPADDNSSPPGPDPTGMDVLLRGSTGKVAVVGEGGVTASTVRGTRLPACFLIYSPLVCATGLTDKHT